MPEPIDLRTHLRIEENAFVLSYVGMLASALALLLFLLSSAVEDGGRQYIPAVGLLTATSFGFAALARKRRFTAGLLGASMMTVSLWLIVRYGASSASDVDRMMQFVSSLTLAFSGMQLLGVYQLHRLAAKGSPLLRTWEGTLVRARTDANGSTKTTDRWDPEAPASRRLRRLSGVVLILGAGLAMKSYADGNGAGLFTWVIYLVWYLRKRARRKAQRTAAALEARDRRPTVLFLRRFADHGVPAGYDAWSRYSGYGNSLNESVSHLMSAVGPVVGLPEPGRSIPRDLGPAPVLVTDDWVSHAAAEMARACLIVIVVANSPGVIREMSMLVEFELLPRTVLVLPPIAFHELRTRWQDFVAAIARVGHEATAKMLATMDVDATVSVVFDSGGVPIPIRASSRARWVMNRALQAAAAHATSNLSNSGPNRDELPSALKAAR